MDEQHHEAMALLEEAKSALAAWPGGDAAAQQAAQERLGELGSHLVEHLSRRSKRCCPWRPSTSPWRSGAPCPGHGMANFHGDKIWLILGLIRERMTDEQRAAMTAHMPPPAVEMWTGFGEQAFKDYSSEVVVEVVNHA